jgi:hypothetical protein
VRALMLATLLAGTVGGVPAPVPAKETSATTTTKSPTSWPLAKGVDKALTTLKGASDAGSKIDAGSPSKTSKPQCSASGSASNVFGDGKCFDSPDGGSRECACPR